jgi:16S rRNA (uracil1498-N3)-methyltransferase
LIRKRFKPFVEDELPALIANTQALVAHPGAVTPCPSHCSEPVTLAVGPEGGFIRYEIDKLTECGFSPIHMGERILRVETAITALLAKLF